MVDSWVVYREDSFVVAEDGHVYAAGHEDSHWNSPKQNGDLKIFDKLLTIDQYNISFITITQITVVSCKSFKKSIFLD